MERVRNAHSLPTFCYAQSSRLRIVEVKETIDLVWAQLWYTSRRFFSRNESMQVIEGNIRATGKKFAIVVSRFNSFVVESLLEGALDTLERHGEVSDDDITLVRVPGAYELPVVAKKLAEKKSFDAIIALGAVIRGGTPHFDFVAGECNKGLAQVSLEYGVPVSFGVITTDSIEQAIERSGTKAGNKGAEAALGALEMVNVIDAVEKL